MVRVLVISALLAAAGVRVLVEDDPARPAVPFAPRVALQIARERPVAEVDERFLSFAIDTAQVVGGEFWAPPGDGQGLLQTHGIDRYDFARPRLRALVRGLAPAYLRIGGTAADWTVYRMHDEPAGAAPLVPDGARWVLTRQRWDEVSAFARALDLRLMFTLNAGGAARDRDGGWDPSSARELIAHAQRNHDPVDVWELGNEANAFPVLHWSWLTADRYAGDIGRARGLLDELGSPARLAGLATAYWPVMGEWRSFTEPVLRRAGTKLDVVTWHFYPQQSHRCPIATRRVRAGQMPTPEALDELERWADRVEGAARAHAPQAEVWLGETGSAQCGGEPGFSDSYADALWWIDELGRAARRGQKVVVRQTLSGSDYGLIDDRTQEPNPSYWASWLWRDLMGTKVLAVSLTPETPALRAYAHCLRPSPSSSPSPSPSSSSSSSSSSSGAAVLALVNVDPTRATTVDLPATAGPPTVLRLEADALTSRRVRLNGTPLAVAADGRLPAPPDLAASPSATRAPLQAGAAVRMPPLSIAFVVLPGAAVPACTGGASAAAR